MSFLEGIFKGSTLGALEGVGKLAQEARSVLTGEMTPEKKLKLETMTMQMESAANLAQMKVNETEARSSSLFVSGWRPAVGWVCVAGFAYTVMFPLLSWGLANYFPGTPKLPGLNTESLMSLLSAMLGMAGIRQAGKNRGQG